MKKIMLAVVLMCVTGCGSVPQGTIIESVPQGTENKKKDAEMSKKNPYKDGDIVYFDDVISLNGLETEFPLKEQIFAGQANIRVRMEPVDDSRLEMDDVHVIVEANSLEELYAVRLTPEDEDVNYKFLFTFDTPKTQISAVVTAAADSVLKEWNKTETIVWDNPASNAAYDRITIKDTREGSQIYTFGGVFYNNQEYRLIIWGE